MSQHAATRPIRRIAREDVDINPTLTDNHLAELKQRMTSAEGVQVSAWKELLFIIQRQEKRIQQLEIMINNR